MIDVEVIKTNEITIEDFHISPKHKRPVRKKYIIPDTLMPIKLTYAKNGHKTAQVSSGRGMTQAKVLARLILDNEINACVQEASDRQWMLRNLRATFPRWSNKASARYMDTFSGKRNKYNQGKLYAGQTLAPLYCWYYNQFGYIIHHRNKTQYLSFDFCKRELQKVKYADPRFFSPGELTQLRNDQIVEDAEALKWYIPPIAEVQHLEQRIKKPIYNSIEFPTGFRKGQGSL
jgi:hypothetical protein